MSPLRWDVLACGFVLAVPVLLLGLRGDLTADEVATRLVWCLVAGWAVVALVRLVGAPLRPARPERPRTTAPPEPPADGDTAPT